MSSISIIIAAVIGLAVIGFPILLFVVALLEKQYFKQDLVPVVNRSPLPLLDYSIAMREQAELLGFIHCGDFYTREGASMVRGNASFWLSTDHRILFSIVDGKFAGMTHRIVRLRSLLSEERVMVTTDEPTVVDISGTHLETVCYHGDLYELYHAHVNRPEYASDDGLRFSPDNILSQVEAIDMLRGRRMVERGLGYFYDESRGILRYTIKGALQMVTRSGLGNRPDVASQVARASVKRPGDPGFVSSECRLGHDNGKADEVPLENAQKDACVDTHDFLEQLKALSKNTNELVLEPCHSRNTAVTKIGGVPWWPQGVERPCCQRGHRMAFVMQILLSDVPCFDDGKGSLLAFHYCSECVLDGKMAWGIRDDETRHAYNLTTFHDLNCRDDGLGIMAEEIVPAHSARIIPKTEVPSYEDVLEKVSEIPDAFPMGDDDFDENIYPPLIHVCRPKLGGWPSWVQGAEWPKKDDREFQFLAQLDWMTCPDAPWCTGYAYLFIDQNAKGELVIQTT